MKHTELKLSILEFILMTKLPLFSGRGLSRVYNQAYKTSYDWHEFSDYLNELYLKGILVIDHIDTNGMNNYRLYKLNS